MQHHQKEIAFENAFPVQRQRIAQLRIPAGNQLSNQLLLSGILRELNSSHDERWACWIGNTPVKSLMSESACRNGNHLLQVVTRRGDDITALGIRALSSGRSHTVALMIDRELSENEMMELEIAASTGNSACLVVQLGQSH